MTQNQPQQVTYYTFIKIGNSTKITAIDEKTLIEASVIAPSTLSQENMQLLALRKLQRMKNKKL